MTALRHCWWLALPLVLAGCGRETAPPAISAAVVQQPAQAAIMASGPPAPLDEPVPTPPLDAGPVVWQPGHWRLSGDAWVWQPGGYVPPPPGQTTWIPGHWIQQPSGTWSWIEGHWA